jgi:hypothetical protein
LAVVVRRLHHFGDLESAAALAGLDLASLPSAPESPAAPANGAEE